MYMISNGKVNLQSDVLAEDIALTKVAVDLSKYARSFYVTLHSLTIV